MCTLSMVVPAPSSKSWLVLQLQLLVLEDLLLDCSTRKQSIWACLEEKTTYRRELVNVQMEGKLRDQESLICPDHIKWYIEDKYLHYHFQVSLKWYAKLVSSANTLSILNYSLPSLRQSIVFVHSARQPQFWRWKPSALPRILRGSFQP